MKEKSPLVDLVKTYRIKHGISQQQLAKAMGYESRQHISNVERGGSFSADLIGRMCAVLRIPKEKVMEAVLAHYKFVGQQQCRIIKATYKLS